MADQDTNARPDRFADQIPGHGRLADAGLAAYHDQAAMPIASRCQVLTKLTLLSSAANERGWLRR